MAYMVIEAKEKYRDGEIWINPISGLEYKWDAKANVWRSTKRYPFGPNPMGFLGDGA